MSQLNDEIKSLQKRITDLEGEKHDTRQVYFDAVLRLAYLQVQYIDALEHFRTEKIRVSELENEVIDLKHVIDECDAADNELIERERAVRKIIDTFTGLGNASKYEQIAALFKK